MSSVGPFVETGGRVNRSQAAWLFEHAADAELVERASQARSRFHPSDRATYLIMAIVNYTNVCVAKCDYCAFYRLPGEEGAYLHPFETICLHIDRLVARGGTLVGFNGGFHPGLSIHDYAAFFQRCHERYPQLTFYEMTVAEFMFSCKVSKVSYGDGARILRDAGTQWVTGGGSEILDDAFRRRHSPLKYRVDDYYNAQRALLDGGIGSTATMVIGFDETLDERLNHLERLRAFQDEVGGRLASFLCWTYKPHHTSLGGTEVSTQEYLRWLAICRIYLDNFAHIRTSVLTKNEDALLGLRYGADDFDLPTEDEVTESAGATISQDFGALLAHARRLGFEPMHREPFPRIGADTQAVRR